jgi:polar amino acid transport system substrate-binding protein
MPGFLCSRRRVIRAATPLLAALVGRRGVALAQLSPDSSAARQALAPMGRLRAALIVSNPVLVWHDATTGNLGGVSVELAAGLAGHLGVPLEPVLYANPARYTGSLSHDIPWDTGFAARDPARGEFLDFSPNFMEVNNVFLVPAESRLTRASEVDQPGIRVAVPQGSAPDLFLTRTLRNAEVVRVPGGADQAVEVLASGRADAYGENAHLLHGVMGRLAAGARILEDPFNVVQMAIAVPKGRDPAGLELLGHFLAQAKRDGTVSHAIERAGLRGVHVAPD